MRVIPSPWERPTVTFSGKKINCWRESEARIISLMHVDYYVG